MAIATGRGFLRSVLAGALTTARTTTSLVAGGIVFTEGVDLAIDETPRGVFALVPDSREPGEDWSEDGYDQSGQCEGTIKVARRVQPDESIDDVGDALIDAVERALESYEPSPSTFTHPDTGVKIYFERTRPIEVGLITPAHDRKSTPRQAIVVLYPTIHYRRVSP